MSNLYMDNFPKDIEEELYSVHTHKNSIIIEFAFYYCRWLVVLDFFFPPFSGLLDCRKHSFFFVFFVKGLISSGFIGGFSVGTVILHILVT